MNDLFIYLSKISAGLAIVFLPYYFLFRNDPNLVIKRFYLLTGVVAAWIFPFITFRKLPLTVDLAPTVFIDLDSPATQPIGLYSAGQDTELTFNWVQILIFVYLAGLSFLFIKNLFIIIKWNITWRRAHGDKGVAYIKNDQVFTFFTRIFVPISLQEEQDLDNVLLHEKAHIMQLHFIDLIITELSLLLTWFNPFSWLISRMIKENHEHLADRQVLSAGINPARYKAQLMNHTLGVNVFRLGNQFNHSLTLKRFKMMKKPTKSPLGIMKIALLIPAVLVTLGLTTGMTPQQKTIKGKVIFADTSEPATGASIVIRNTTTGTVVDRDGTFLLNVNGNPEIVISHVGYGTLSINATKIRKKPLKLKRKAVSLDLGSVPFDVSKGSSGEVSVRKKDGSDASLVFILDGKPMVGGIEDLNPDLIESVSVIKDPNHPLVKKFNANDGLILVTSKNYEESEAEKALEKPLKEGKDVFYIVEDMPKFPGGKAALKTYIYSNLEYPEEAKKKGKKGEAVVHFVIDTEGKPQNVKMIRSNYREFDEPAMKVIREMPDWTPGKQRKKAVSVQFALTINFTVPKE